jgi:class 3 adenylate cyclase
MSSISAKSHDGANAGGLSLDRAAERAGVAATMLRRWVREGLIPPYDGNWSPAAVSHARIVAKLRERGRSLEDIRRASDEGRLAFGYVEGLFDTGQPAYTLEQAARATGLEPAEEMLELTRRLLPLSAPVTEQVYQRYLQHVVEQDVVGHMESDLEGDSVDLGRMRVAIAFADLAGYTRLTEEVGEREAVDAVERFVEVVESSLPNDARVIKAIGDEVMIVGSDPAGLTEWAVAFQCDQSERNLARIAIHYGNALCRDGDYFGRDVNIASRVAARAGGGDVLVTRPVVERARGDLELDRIAEVRPEGFSESTEAFISRRRAGR